MALIGNAYFALGGGTTTVMSYTTLAALRAAGFEAGYGVFGDPLLSSPMSGVGIGAMPAADVSTITYFDLAGPASPAIDAGVDLTVAPFGFTISRDFAGSAVSGPWYDIGAVCYPRTIVAPTGFTATPVATNQINLAWIDQATNETGYVVDRSIDSNSWVQVVLTGANVTNCSDTGLTTNTLYYYRVAASNAVGLSAYCFATGVTWTAYEAWRHTQFDATALTNAAISGDAADPDHDGLNNLQEFLAGTDPTNAASVLALFMPLVVPGGAGFVVSWQSASNKFYTLQTTTNLVAPGFADRVKNVSATPMLNVYTDTLDIAGQKFYRVKLE